MSKYSEVLQIPGKLVTVGTGDTPYAMGGAFTIAWANEETTVVATPAGGGDDVTVTILAGSSCPIAITQVTSTTADIIVGN